MNDKRRRRLLAGISLGVATLTSPFSLALAQQPPQAQANAIRQSCRGDYMTHCSGAPTGGAAALACLQQHAAQASPGCQQALRAASGATQAKAAPAPAKR